MFKNCKFWLVGILLSSLALWGYYNPTSAMANGTLPEIPQVDVFDDADGQTLIFLAAGDVSQYDVESCGVTHHVTWTKLADGRWRTEFPVVGLCDSATLVGEKTWVDQSPNWDIKDGWVRRVSWPQVPSADPNPDLNKQIFLPLVSR